VEIDQNRVQSIDAVAKGGRILGSNILKLTSGSYSAPSGVGANNVSGRRFMRGR
jgi:hypothetical protein